MIADFWYHQITVGDYIFFTALMMGFKLFYHLGKNGS